MTPLSAPQATIPISGHDVVWDTASLNSAGSIPIGNGVLVANVWVEAASGDILMLLARSDALSEVCRVLKLGRIRLRFSPAIFRGAANFRQHLSLKDGVIEISSERGHVKVFVDSENPVLHVSGELPGAAIVTAALENWRTSEHAISAAEMPSAWSAKDAPFPLIESADVVLATEGSVTWYHRNESSVVPKLWEEQDLTGLPGTFDPLLHRTFGGRMSGSGFLLDGEQAIHTDKPVKRFEIQVSTHTSVVTNVKGWLLELGKIESRNAEARTRKWWNSFWAKSYVEVGEKSIGQGYALQRYVQACQGLGEFPIKFNGGYYCVEPTEMGKDLNPDWRNWGDSHWYQNVRHMYHPMLESGDFEMMEPFFRLYENARPLSQARAEHYHHAKGAYFPETMTVFGTYAGSDYGWKRDGLQPNQVQCPWWQYAWNQGLELVGLLLDRWDFTRDETFLVRRVLPMASSVLQYFDSRFAKDEAGRIILDPTQAVETYWTGVINDTPAVAGLLSVTRRLCKLPKKLVSGEQWSFYERMATACPHIAITESQGVKVIDMAQKYDKTTSNCENPALYAVWPFRQACLARPDLVPEAKAAYAQRLNRLDNGWGYDGNVAALLGMTEEAKRILISKCANSHPKYRWPATWGPNYDWLPDQNHGGNLLNTTHLMLIQSDSLEEGGAIRLFPAWPVEWNVKFRLHAAGNTVVEAELKGGHLQSLEVTPEKRRKDVIVPSGISANEG